MSASEKLRTQWMELGVMEMKTVLHNVLPQFIFLVEAAETTTMTLNTKFGSGPDVVADLRAALASLDEALA